MAINKSKTPHNRVLTGAVDPTKPVGNKNPIGRDLPRKGSWQSWRQTAQTRTPIPGCLAKFPKKLMGEDFKEAVKEYTESDSIDIITYADKIAS